MNTVPFPNPRPATKREASEIITQIIVEHLPSTAIKRTAFVRELVNTLQYAPMERLIALVATIRHKK